MQRIGRVLVAMCLFGAATAQAKQRVDVDLAYRLTLVRSPAVSVQVELRCQGSDSSATWLGVSREWGGVNTGGDDLANAAAWGPGGEALAVTHPEPNRWRVQHAPGAAIRFTYEIPANTHQTNNSPSTNWRPLVNEHLFHMYGDLGLVWPVGVDESVRRRVSVSWRDFDAAGWTVVSSFGAGTRPYKFSTSIAELRSSVWMAGDLELVRRDIKGRPLWVAVQRAPWTFQAAELADMAHTIVRMERAFFNDYDYPFYLITLIPVGQAGTGSRSMGGTGLTNSFSLCMVADTPLRGNLGQGINVSALLAHEMFHQWDGHTITPVDPEELSYWFTEGFTDFYTRRLLYRNGLMSNEDYALHANRKLSELWTSEVRNAPNARILADFWKHDAVKRLPYVRGDVVAMMVDHGIRVRSAGKRSLDDLMRKLVRDGKSHHAKVSTESLLERFAEYAGPAVAASVRSIVVEGATPVVARDTFAPCFTVGEQDVTPFELGFEFVRTRETRVITGLVPGSAAAQAGLQEGQPIGAWSVVNGDVSRPVVVTILENGQRREIEYQPRGAAVRVPQLTTVPQKVSPAGAETARCSNL